MTTERLLQRAAARVRPWLLVLLTGLFDPALAQPPTQQIELLLSDDHDTYRELAGAFQSELSLACAHRCAMTPSVRVSTVGDWDASAPRDLLVAVGNQAALQALASRAPRLLYGLIPRFTWRNLQQLHPDEDGRSSAVYLDQPLRRQFDLLAIALPLDQRRIGVLLGPDSIRQEPELQRNAERLDMTLVVRKLHDQDEVGPAMEELAGQIDLLLALPDPMVFNRDTLYGILLTSYGAGVPVAGYSQSLVEAGAMLALYTSVPDMARHLAQTSATYLIDGGDLPAPGPSRYYEIAVNRNVARSLGYELPEATQLRKLLESLGGGDDAAQAAQ